MNFQLDHIEKETSHNCAENLNNTNIIPYTQNKKLNPNLWRIIKHRIVHGEGREKAIMKTSGQLSLMINDCLIVFRVK